MRSELVALGLLEDDVPELRGIALKTLDERYESDVRRDVAIVESWRHRSRPAGGTKSLHERRKLFLKQK